MTLHTIILAAGKGTRMKSTRPKVLQTLAGKALVKHVLDTCQAVESDGTVLIYGFGGEMVKADLVDYPVTFAEQAEQLGTGHAVKMALPHLPTDGKSLILYGDVPLTQADTLAKLVAANTDGISMLTLDVANPFGLGRIVRDNGKVVAIVEQKDATEAQKQITEINSGIYCVDNALLHKYLPALSNDNAQGEYYLTDIVKMAVADGIAIATIAPEYEFEIEGVNDRIQLANLERTYQAHQIHALQLAGVQFADPNRVDIRGSLTCGQDVFIDINTVFIGDVTLGNGVQIDAGTVISNTTIGDNTHIKPNCVIDDSTIGAGVTIGPFAHLRPKTVLADKVKIGNFVETKKTTVGLGSKINHLSYVGDATLGADVNIGAGVITCNYDGVNKFNTIIGDNAFVGSNSSLVAPVKVGAGATIGAGSVITKDSPDGKLTLARSKQITIDAWTRPVKK
ncbi:bifunctional UDP-N-acetylglucosamine diphosphorylase/glucosamine-1-phosphate N-acetyltransferase GlmU [Moraxella sp. FZLJ2107]|uniref:bifunctional UDP-N-acetylglucosamine diphosphorylase/glucosamine-1-phosphate N-acetyltransferase GlmU n=1 Tax=unclassified Moraxella TaxID=2685852 RepID=UPI0020C851C7|nr:MULTISPECIES: bifunctional UDP-N-acetylglucosamine diphosphorylase/glucosamine-1-phosphate N-acetyltransferase GlmU [unclassified Moraxella]UTO04082.1 bifunctional UDP-N-acetylglucosamine diphosphorylase/glucosamine-1-phosphate N-acetyltransferase GlmU [Moraxella sp. FZLJ2107]UTO22914.1 bifunctional UDP-N-acetylglucosamine diphosphorylase/glucosamine-1-phosphate N-acetyltransferase GlmU [Moraxella sp. FZLJ2109]